MHVLAKQHLNRFTHRFRLFDWLCPARFCELFHRHRVSRVFTAGQELNKVFAVFLLVAADTARDQVCFGVAFGPFQTQRFQMVNVEKLRCFFVHAQDNVTVCATVRIQAPARPLFQHLGLCHPVGATAKLFSPFCTVVQAALQRGSVFATGAVGCKLAIVATVFVAAVVGLVACHLCFGFDLVARFAPAFALLCELFAFGVVVWVWQVLTSFLVVERFVFPRACTP